MKDDEGDAERRRGRGGGGTLRQESQHHPLTRLSQLFFFFFFFSFLTCRLNVSTSFFRGPHSMALAIDTEGEG